MRISYDSGNDVGESTQDLVLQKKAIVFSSIFFNAL